MKNQLNVDVMQAARDRLHRIFDNFEHVYVSLSGGKDSGVLFYLALDEARRRGRKLHVLVVDLEAQYRHTIEFVHRCFAQPEVEGHWVCLPLNLRNSVSQFRPFWLCWDPEKKDQWVRTLPESPRVVSSEAFFPFFERGMEFEEFVPAYGQWVANQHRGRTVCLIGIRSDESINRFRTIKDERKGTWNGYMWTTKLSENLYNAYPIYDWQTRDIWIANGKKGWDYNKVYDLMHLAGLSIHQMRLCQPYGDDQRKGLWLFKILEPETWTKIVARVEGANFGNRHATEKTLGHMSLVLPEGHTWESYSRFLLATMPPPLSAHYQERIEKFLLWWKKAGWEVIPDRADAHAESHRKAPSWHRIAKTLIKGDYWCKSLSFSMTKRQHDRQLALALLYMTNPGEGYKNDQNVS